MQACSQIISTVMKIPLFGIKAWLWSSESLFRQTMLLVCDTDGWFQFGFQFRMPIQRHKSWVTHSWFQWRRNSPSLSSTPCSSPKENLSDNFLNQQKADVVFKQKYLKAFFLMDSKEKKPSSRDKHSTYMANPRGRSEISGGFTSCPAGVWGSLRHHGIVPGYVPW